MVDIFKKEICNYCKNTECKKNECYKYKLVEIVLDGINIYKCTDYKKDSSKIISTARPLSITAKRDFIKYHEI